MKRVKKDRSRFPTKTQSVAARVTEQVSKKINHIVYVEGYVDVGDYVRNLIRKDFKKRGVRVKLEEKPEGEETNSLTTSL